VAVLLTATAGSMSEVAAESEPAVVRFLAKPFRLPALLECVQGLLAGMEREKPFISNCAAVSPEFFIG
jgi:hypothetical protein